jgi:3-oxoadipate enol-lactonase
MDNAPELLAIPGTLCAPGVFDRLARRLAGDVTVTGVPWMTEPGPWDIPTVVERVVERYPRPGLVLGHSTGGAIALQLALTYPRRVRGLVLVNTGANMHGHGDVDRTLAAMRDNWGPDVYTALIDRSFATPPRPADRAALLAYAETVPPAAALEVLHSQRDLDLTARLAEIRCPVTVVHGVHDRVRTRQNAQALVDGIPDARLCFVPTGHTPVYEDPDLVADEVRLLLGTILAMPGS